MYVTLVNIQVKREHIDDFIEATVENCHNAVHEHGNLRFDFLQSADDPTHFVLYEAYETAEDAAAHKGASHYLIWKQTVADWMETPRLGLVYWGLFPEGASE